MSTGTRLSFTEAQRLVLYFDGRDRDVTIGRVAKGVVKNPDGSPGPAGVYAFDTSAPEKGGAYLGPGVPLGPQAAQPLAWREIEAALDRLTLVAKFSGRTFDTEGESLTAYNDVKAAEKRLRELILTYRHLPGKCPRV